MNKMKSILWFLIFSTTCFSATTSFAEELDWWRSQRNLSTKLLQGKVTFSNLVSEVSGKKPKTGDEAMMKVSVMLRTGSKEKSLEALKELEPFLNKNSSHLLSSIYYYIFDEMRDLELAKLFVEMYADRFTELTIQNRLLKYFKKSGWTVDQIDKWLAGMPKGKRNLWYKERFRFNVVNGRGDAYVKKEMDAVKKNPEDIDFAILLLDSLCYSRSTGKEVWDLTWMPETIKPKFTTQAEKLAGHLLSLKKYPEALHYLMLAKEIPITEDDLKSQTMMYAMVMTNERLKVLYEVRIIEKIADTMVKMKRTKEAQEWMVIAADIRKKNKLGMNAMFAGQIQGASGQRVIEGRIKKEEEKSKDDPKYWTKRALYYRGRKEADNEEEALLKALSLTVPKPNPDKIYRGYMDNRAWALSDYANFLKRQKRLDEGEALIRKEIKEAPPKSASTIRAVILLNNDYRKDIKGNDEMLWNWLSAQAPLGYAGQGLMRTLLENSDKKSLIKQFERAEKIVGNNVDDIYELGWIMNRLKFPERSIPLLKKAMIKEKTMDKGNRGRAAFALFESYLDLDDWKSAETLFPEASRRLSAGEIPKWYSEVAVKAAKTGEKKEAMRIWTKVANIAPYNRDGLDELVKYGLKDELKEFYTQMQKKMPYSDTPAKTVKYLDNM